LRACHINHAGNKRGIGRETGTGGDCPDTYSPTNAAVRTNRLCPDKGGGEGDKNTLQWIIGPWTIGGQQFTVVEDPELD
jgi:hypothetical protein